MNINWPVFLAGLVTSLVLASNVWSSEYGTLIFQDTFDRTESQELKDEPGNGWTTSSDTTAKGYKEVDLRDGHLYIYTHAEANHATSVRHEFAFRDGTLGLRFMLEDEDDTLTLNFADMDLKTVWAGHLFKVTIGTSDVMITDQKTGEMDLKIREARQNNTISEAEKNLLAKKSTSFPNKLATNRWHQVYATINGDELTCTIDGKLIGTFRSEGFAHETKRLLRLLVAKNAYVDDVQIWRAK
ncbi:MAG: hypothetical protein O3C20_07905 [Verrucomicrobia bacterium]|nr:hypothetical protein [Verrucomicrobiota bacterium]